MIRDTAYAGLITAASAVATAKAIPQGPVLLDLGGIAVPIVPALIGILATVLVRIIVVTSKPVRRNLRVYNIAVTLLTMLGTATYITDNQLGPGAAFWTGLGCGAAGVGLVELGRTQFMAALKIGGRAMLASMFNRKPDDPKSPFP